METVKNKVAELLEDEWLIVRNSGETPEIALHSALYYLTVSEDGPRLTLDEKQVASLRQAAIERYYEIIVRDLKHANYGTPGYRGIKRSIINYRRFCTFCERQKISGDVLRKLTSDAFLNFLDTEVAEVSRMPRRSSIINCSFEVLESFAADLSIDLTGFPMLAELCSDVE